MEIRASVKMDYKTIRKFTFHSIFTSPLLLILLGFLTVFELDQLLTLIMELIYPTGYLTVDLFYIIVFLLPTMVWIFILLRPRMIYRKLGHVKNHMQYYIFQTNRLTITSETELSRGESEISYDLLKKVKETAEYLYLTTTNRRVYIICKTSIENGNLEELLEFFSEQKHIKCSFKSKKKGNT